MKRHILRNCERSSWLENNELLFYQERWLCCYSCGSRKLKRRLSCHRMSEKRLLSLNRGFSLRFLCLLCDFTAFFQLFIQVLRKQNLAEIQTLIFIISRDFAFVQLTVFLGSLSHAENAILGCLVMLQDNLVEWIERGDWKYWGAGILVQ